MLKEYFVPYYSLYKLFWLLIVFIREMSFQKTQSLYINKTLANLFGFLGLGFLMVAKTALDVFSRYLRYVRRPENMMWWLDWRCHLKGASTFEKSFFIQALT